jgi:hypothetical protein
LCGELRGVACRQEGALRPLFLEGFAPDVGVVAGALEFWPRVESLRDIAPLDAAQNSQSRPRAKQFNRSPT